MHAIIRPGVFILRLAHTYLLSTYEVQAQCLALGI